LADRLVGWVQGVGDLAEIAVCSLRELEFHCSEMQWPLIVSCEGWPPFDPDVMLKTLIILVQGHLGR
jgi:hypothetical protein